jgi:hypothetical protein
MSLKPRLDLIVNIIIPTGARPTAAQKGPLVRPARRPAWSREPGLPGLGRLVHGCVVRAPVQRRELRYGSQEFLAATDLAHRWPNQGSPSDLMRNLVRDPDLVRGLAAVWRLPVVDLRVRQADADAWSGASFGPAGRDIFAGRLAQATLELPAVEERYLAGRAKQALRTNLRRARDLGVTSGRISSYEAWFEAASDIAEGPAQIRDMARPEPGQQVSYYVARDAHQTPLAFAGAARFGQFAVLFVLASRPDRRPRASCARYQLHTCLAFDLSRAGVKYLLVGSALRQTVGNQYFQHLLGYRARHLRVEVTECGAT